MKGPNVIVCRAHSGGRILSEAFIRNGVQMGQVAEHTKDTKFFAIRRNDKVKYLIENSFKYPNLGPSGKAPFISIMKSVVSEYIESNNIDTNKPFGWKFGESLFLAPVILDAFPTSKIIHLIRDGRDVMLSRIDARFNQKLLEPFNRLIVEGPNSMYNILKIPFNLSNVHKHRSEFEFIHWKTCIEYSQKYLKMRSNYLECRYEDICSDTIQNVRKIMNILNIDLSANCEKWLEDNVNNSRIGKWKNSFINNNLSSIIRNDSTLNKLQYT